MDCLWVDYNLMSTIAGLFVAGEANFSDHGANRLGASALMQGLADGYFILPCTLADYLARMRPDTLDGRHPVFRAAEVEVAERVRRLLDSNGTRTGHSYHRERGHLIGHYCAIARTDAGH